MLNFIDGEFYDRELNLLIIESDFIAHHVWSGCFEGSDKSGGETLSAGHFLCRFQPPFAVFRYQYGRHNTYLRAV